MLRLNVNPAVLAMCMSGLSGTAEELDYFTGQLLRSNTETDLYKDNPPPDAGLDVVGPHAATKNGDWASMVHPHVLAQLVVDLSERLSLPCPDNTYVFEAGDWKPLSFIQPSPPAAAPPAPVIAPPPPPMQLAPAPVVETPPLAQTPPPDLMAQLASPQVLQSPTLDQTIEQGAAAAAQPAPAPQPAAAPAQAPTPPPSAPAAPASAFPTVEFGMYAPIMMASKGVSPFDKDPGGDIPKTPPSRIIRDVVDMAPHFFAAPPAEVVGKGAGSTQRLRAYMAAAALIDTFLAGVPDPATPVAFLRHQLAHMRYNASTTPAGPTLKAHEDYLFTSVKGDK